MTTHLRFGMQSAYESGNTDHPQEVMEKLGVTYQDATPQSMGDQWWFWNCENIPEKLPDFLSVLDIDPMDCIGWGLYEKDAVAIRDYKK